MEVGETALEEEDDGERGGRRETHIGSDTWIRTHTHTHARTQAHIRTCMHTHTHTHTHTQRSRQSQVSHRDKCSSINS